MIIEMQEIIERRFIKMKYVRKTLTLFGIFLTQFMGLSAQVNKQDFAFDHYKIKTAAEAVARAIEYVGIDRLKNISLSEIEKETQLVTISNDNTPFFHKLINDRPVWQIQFPNIRLIEPRAIDSIDTHLRTFTALIDPVSGDLLKIHSILDGYDTSISPLPPAEVAEMEFQRGGREIYLACPGTIPKVKFWDALGNTFESPLRAGEIVGVYVIHSQMDSKPQPVWAIDLRGIPARPTFHPDGDKYVPEYERNHLRTVIDAETRHQMFTNNAPSIERKPEDRMIAPKDSIMHQVRDSGK